MRLILNSMMVGKRGFHRTLLCTSALAFLPVSLAGATDITVPNGTTETTTITLPDLGDRLFIEQGGAIDTTGNGVGAFNHNQTITNNGSIDSDQYGIVSDGANTIITNNGSINSVLSRGITFTGDNVQIINNGLINAGDVGIWVQGSDAKITNSGYIAGGSAAIRVQGKDARLNLLAGSVLVGDVQFRQSGLKLNIGTGLNLYLDYRFTTLGSMDALTSAIPIVHDEVNTIIYTVDPTGFALAQSFVQTTAEVVHDAVGTGSERGNRFGGGFAGQSSFAYGTDAPGFETTGPRGWVSSFGGYQSQGGSGMVTGGTQAYGGLVSGGGFASDDRLYGAFAGGSYTRLETEYDTQEIDATSVFGGVYAGTRAGALWVRGGLMGGYTEFSSDRTVANNMVAGGLETATADYGATFISPSVTVGRGMGERTEISLGGHYAALFVDGYSESGSAANLTVASRTVQVAAMRAKASYLAHQKQTQSGRMSVETWAGADGVFNFGSDVDASVAAGAFDTFSASFFDTAVMGFAGLGVNHRSSNGKWSLNASVEGRYGTNDYWDVKATATAQAAF